VKKFAENSGASIIQILEKTNYKGVTEYYEETSYLERVFYQNAVNEYNRQKSKALNQNSR